METDRKHKTRGAPIIMVAQENRVVPMGTAFIY